MLQKLTENFWVVAAPQRVFGIPIGTRMTVVRLTGGGLFIHSPVLLTEELRAAISSLGEVRAVVAPNRYHHLYVKGYIETYPQALVYAAPGLREKRKDLRFHDVLTEKPAQAWAVDLDQTLVRGIPALNEVVFFHPASRSLMLTDLCCNFPPAGTLWTRLYQKLEDCDGKFAMARLIKLAVRDRQAFRVSFEQILQWDFNRVVVTHGEVLESGGKEAFRNAFQWLHQ